MREFAKGLGREHLLFMFSTSSTIHFSTKRRCAIVETECGLRLLATIEGIKSGVVEGSSAGSESDACWRFGCRVADVCCIAAARARLMGPVVGILC